MSLLSNAPALRRRACALALPGVPLALLAATLVSPTDSTDNAVQLRAAAAHPDRWQGAALLELLTAALFPLAAAGIVHLVRRRGTALAHVGALLAGLGTLGMTAIAIRHLFIYGLTATDQASALRVLDRLDNHGGAAAMPLMIAGPLAWIVLAGAAARAGLVSRWIVLGAVAFAVADSLPIPAAEEIQSLVGIAAFGAIGFRMLRLGDDEWEASAPPAATTSARPTNLASASARGATRGTEMGKARDAGPPHLGLDVDGIPWVPCEPRRRHVRPLRPGADLAHDRQYRLAPGRDRVLDLRRHDGTDGAVTKPSCSSSRNCSASIFSVTLGPRATRRWSSG